jgi:hypothetical protein
VNTKREVLGKLFELRILFVVIGGIALRIYNSPRVTHVIDLAIKTTDVDDVIDLMYGCGYFLVTGIEPGTARIALTGEGARKWVSDTKSGSMTFVGFEMERPLEAVPIGTVDINTEIDFLFEPAVPIMRLKERATTITLDGNPVLVASPSDLIVLKERRKDRSAADDADIACLRELLGKKQEQPDARYAEPLRHMPASLPACVSGSRNSRLIATPSGEARASRVRGRAVSGRRTMLPQSIVRS